MGKLPFKDLKDLLGCIKKNSRVVVPPMPGFDSGVHEIGNNIYVVISTDPCIGVPQEWFGWLLVHYAASDVALFGAQPQFCTVNLLGPPGTGPAAFKKVMKQACDAADELGMVIITGHTGTYEGLSTLLATCTAYGIIRKDELITPAGAKPGDYLLCTKPIGLETLVNFVLTHRTLAKELFGPRQALSLAKQIKMQTCVEEALLLAKIGGVSAMHDATEGGLVAALNEMAEASNVGFSIDFAKLLILPELQILARYFNLTWEQIMAMSSTGTLLAAISPHSRDRVIEALLRRNLAAKIIGAFSESKECLIKYDEKEVKFPREADDPYAQILQI